MKGCGDTFVIRPRRASGSSGKGWLEYNGKRYWVGMAEPFGLLIYDPEAQSGVPGDRVNLFIVDRRRTASFVRAGGVRDAIRAMDPTSGDSARAVAEYAEARGSWPRLLAHTRTTARRRVHEATRQRQWTRRPRATRCWRCKEHLSSANSPVCEWCRGLQCSCGACRCR